MATTLMMGSDLNSNLRPFSEDKKEPADEKAGRPRSNNGGGRRKSKAGNESSQKKKLSQRGMGVERLERLRLQEMSNPLATSYTLQSHHPFVAASFADPTTAINNVPPAHVPFANFCSSFEGTNGLLVQRVGGNGAFLGQRNGAEHHFHVGLYGTVGNFGPSNANNVRFGNVNEASKELSSTPNIIRCFSDHCGVCHKKKRVDGKILGCDGVKDVYPELPLMNGCGVVGFNDENNQKSNTASKDFWAKPSATQTGYAVGNTDQRQAEVVAIHKKGSSCGGAVVMEYEFFPEKGGGRTYTCKDNELMMKQQQQQHRSEASSVADHHQLDGEAYCGVSTTGVESSSAIDLSLKLYY